MVKLIIGIHNHQPVGNFGFVLEQAYQSAYLPFVDVLRRHPKIKTSMHFSGILYDWLETAHPDYLDKLREMAQPGQIEILSGGYYEPVLALLPDADARGQVGKMSEYVSRRFGIAPKGVWLAERVWEPQLAGQLHDCGVEYTVLDDIHFFSAGIGEDKLSGYYITEYQGKPLRVFPISSRLRYLMPFADPEKTIEFLSKYRGTDCAFVMADDGEKFGLWPGTGDLVYKRGWLDRMFSLIENNSQWLETETFSGRLASSAPLGAAYLPTTSYHELSQWALPPDPSAELERLYKSMPEKDRAFLRGGYFRNFLSKYPESNRMYRKTLRVSRRVHESDAPGKAQALDRLWMSQCNCGYWHGVFGGLYLPHIRAENYRNMIKAEKALETGGPPRIFRQDWDNAGKEQLFVESRGGNWNFSPARGGALWQWDWKEGEANWCNVLSRRPEPYHRAVKTHSGKNAARQRQLADMLCYDWHLRQCLLDHFIHPETALDGFAKAAYGEQGDFVLGEYQAEVAEEDGFVTVTMSRKGAVWVGDAHSPVEVGKVIRLNCADGSWSADYRITNLADAPRKLHFGAELCFAFSSAEICPKGRREAVTEAEFRDPVCGNLSLKCAAGMELWSFPLETVSLSENGAERTYQGSALLCLRRPELAPGASDTFKLELKAFK
ncbi:MAG: alpha-amylase/4-alpha-glucanotransferase domain-containing protein [Elusimicrobiales bacterium]